MSLAIGPLISTVLARTRDAHGMATTRDLIRTFFSHAQRIVNLRFEHVLVTESLTTLPRQLIYGVVASLPLSARIKTIRDADDRDLDLEPHWRTLSNFDGSWFRHTGSQHRAYALIGRDIIVLYPAKIVESTVVVLSVKLTTTLIDDDSLTEIPDSDTPLLLDFVELMASLKSRKMVRAAELWKQLESQLKLRVMM